MKKFCLVLSCWVILNSCANMITPTGGNKDVFPPKLLSVNDKKEHENVKTIYFEFDEFIVLNNWDENFYVSPPIKKHVQKQVKGQSLQLIIDDTLAENTTYNLALSNSIKDLNEGNVLDSLNYTFSTTDQIDSLSLIGQLKDAYALTAIENAWVMLFEMERIDDVFREIPNYVAKTDDEGMFNFPNLKGANYKIAAITNFDFIYNEGEQIAFLNHSVNSEMNNFISLFAFDPIIDMDSTILLDTANIPPDSIVEGESTEKEKVRYGNLRIRSTHHSSAIFQLLQNGKIVAEFVFAEPPYNLTTLIPGKYQLKYIFDANQDGKWNTGSWENKIQPEKVTNYPDEITIRSNWDLELDWILD